MLSLRRAVLALGMVLAFGQSALGGDLSLSLGVFATPSEYRGMDTKVLPMPLLRYEGERLFVNGYTAGAYLWKDERQRLFVGASLLPQYFRSSKSDDWAMKQLDNRNISVLATLGYGIDTEWGSLSLRASGDVTGTSDGFLADVSYSYTLRAGDFSLTPGAGVLWTSSDHNDYYYGISRSESSRSGLRRYSPDSGFSPYLRVAAGWDMTEHWSLYASWTAMFLSDEIRNSPMVDRDVQNIFGGGITYRF